MTTHVPESGTPSAAGAGGQLGFADRDNRVGFAYLGNHMGDYSEARARDLTAALHSAIGA